MLVRQDVRRLQPIAAAGAADTLNLEFRTGRQYRGRVEIPMSGTLSEREVTRLAIDAVSPSAFLKTSGIMRRPRFWLEVVLASLRLAASLPLAKGLTVRGIARKVMVDAILAMA